MTAIVVHLPASRSLRTVDLAALTDARTFRRGIEYLRDGRVTALTHDRGRVSATVSGAEPYRVELGFGPSGLEHRCTCPCGADDIFCKHLVAVALSAIGPDGWATGAHWAIDAAEEFLSTGDGGGGGGGGVGGGKAADVVTFCEHAAQYLEQNESAIGDSTAVGELADRLTALRRRAHPSVVSRTPASAHRAPRDWHARGDRRR